MTELDFLTKSKFSKKVEHMVNETGQTYMETVIHICETHDIDISQISKFLTPLIKGKIEAEAKALNFLPKGNELPI